MKVALTQRISKLEKKVADRAQANHLKSRSVYQPSVDELAEAVAILVECGAVRGRLANRLLPKICR